MSALILGVGNILLGDEGIGIRVVEELENRYAFPEEVMVLDGGTAGIELLRYIEGRDLLILIDAMRAGLAPGTVFKVEGEDVPKRFMTRISPHQIGLSDLAGRRASLRPDPQAHHPVRNRAGTAGDRHLSHRNRCRQS